MSFNLMPGRMRDRLEIRVKSDESDSFGVPIIGDILTTIKGNVYDRSGNTIKSNGTELSEDVITVLTYRRDIVSAGQNLIWLNRGGDYIYEITNVKPGDNMFKTMIITAESVSHAGNPNTY